MQSDDAGDVLGAIEETCRRFFHIAAEVFERLSLRMNALAESRSRISAVGLVITDFEDDFFESI